MPRGTSPKTVTAAVDAVGRTVDARDFRSRRLKLYPVGLKADLISGVRPALLVLGFAGVFLLLALMVNLALVLLARAAQREHEFAVSRALGANAVAVVRATVFEGGVLGLIGGVAGALVAIWGTRMLVALAPLELPRREAVAVDWSIGAVIIGLGVLLGLLAAAVPATWVARVSPVVTARGERGARRRRSWPHAAWLGSDSGSFVTRAAQRRRTRSAQLRAATACRPGLRGGGRPHCARAHAAQHVP